MEIIYSEADAKKAHMGLKLGTSTKRKKSQNWMWRLQKIILGKEHLGAIRKNRIRIFGYWPKTEARGNIVMNMKDWSVFFR